MYKISLVSISILSLGLAACGGGGSSSSGSDAAATISGSVADGYLLGATACFDDNDNKNCESSEPTAMTGNGGVFTLELNADQANRQSERAVIVNVPTTAIDEDDGLQVGNTYVLTAPPGKAKFISPLTTMIHTKMEDEGLDNPEDAEALIKSQMGLADNENISLFDDYIDKKQDSTESVEIQAEYKRLHEVAKITAHILGENQTAVEQAAEAAGSDPEELKKELINLITLKVIVQLSGVYAQAEQYAEQDDGFDKHDSTHQSDVEEELNTAVDTSDIANDLEEQQIKQELASTLEEANLPVLMTTGGGTSFVELQDDRDDEFEGFSIEIIKMGAAENGRYPWAATEKELLHNGSSFFWTDEQADEDHFGKQLSANGWIAEQEGPFTLNGNIATDTSTGQQYAVSLVDISGQNIEKVVNGGRGDHDTDFEEGSNAEQSSSYTFSEGAQAHKWKESYTQDIYRFGLHHDGDLTVNVDYCHQGSSILYTGVDTNCNTVWVSSDGENGGEATSLNALFSTSSNNYVSIHHDASLVFKRTGSETSGTVRVYRHEGTDTSFQRVLEDFSTTWELKTVHGKELLLVKILPKFQDEFSDDGEQALFFTLVDGYVRRGEFISAGTVRVIREFGFNDRARQDIEAAIVNHCNTNTEDDCNQSSVSI